MRCAHSFLSPHFRISASDSSRRFTSALSVARISSVLHWPQCYQTKEQHNAQSFLEHCFLRTVTRDKGCNTKQFWLLTKACLRNVASLAELNVTKFSLNASAQFSSVTLIQSTDASEQQRLICQIEPLSGARSPWGVNDVMALRNWQRTSRTIKPHFSRPKDTNPLFILSRTTLKWDTAG